MIAGLLLFALKWISVSGCGMCAGIGPLCFQKIPPMGFSPLCGAWGLVSLGVQGCLSVSSFVLLLPCWALVRWVPPPPPPPPSFCARVCWRCLCLLSCCCPAKRKKDLRFNPCFFVFSPSAQRAVFKTNTVVCLCGFGVCWCFVFVYFCFKTAKGRL